MVSGAVLIGGESRRMGRPKAAIDLGDGPLAAVLAGRLSDAGCEPVWLIGADRGVDSDVVRIDDRWPGRGPLGGIATALVVAAEQRPQGADGVVVVACDLPDLDVDSVRRMIAAFSETHGRRLVVACSDRGREPLIALWPVAEVDAIVTSMPRQVAVHAAIDELDPIEIVLPVGAARNANRPTDLWPDGHSPG